MRAISGIILLSLMSLTNTVFADADTFLRHGCIEFSTATVEAEICQQLDCVERASNGNCKLSACAKTQRSKYVDVMNTGCTRTVDCGKGAYFLPGTPDDPVKESTEDCDWRPCIETDPETGKCESYDCLSKRTTTTETTSYPGALCVKLPVRAVSKPSIRSDSRAAAASPGQISTSVPMPADSAAQTVYEMFTAVASYDDEYAVGISTEERLRRKAAADRLDTLWDREAMFREILGEHWNALKPQEKSEYLYLASALFRKDRYPQMRMHLNEVKSVEVLGEKRLQDNTTMVTAKVISKETGGAFLPVFSLHKTDTGWKIYSLSSDGGNLMLIYRQLYDTLIRVKGVPYMLATMRKRLKEPR